MIRSIWVFSKPKTTSGVRRNPLPMKVSSSSKSMPSPGRPRVAVPQISLSSSLSGRLKTNAGGIKGGGHASPMFPAGGKKRGSALEDHEPSSPKVTCIGHVRVKSKKQGKKPGVNHHYHHRGEVSFRRVEVGESGLQRSGRQDSNLMSSQRQVSDGVEACRKFRMFGVEWSCFQPCRSSCSAKGEEKGRAGGDAEGETHGGGSCGAVIARWLVALHEGPDGKGEGRKIELVVGEEEHMDERSGSYRRRVFEGLDFDEKGIRGFEGDEEEVEERGRVSVCIPPKNALLLMRCRSDPVKMAALVGRFCNDTVQLAHIDEEGTNDLGNVSGIRDPEAIRGRQDDERVVEQLTEFNDEGGNVVKEGHCAMIVEDDEEDEEEAEVNLLANELRDLISSNIEEETTAMEETQREDGASNFTHLDLVKQDLPRRDDSGDRENESRYGCVLSVHFISESGESEDRRELAESEAKVLHSTEEKGASKSKEDRKYATRVGSDLDGRGKQETEAKVEAPKLPDCLLLMMREPKLSMEVSKETWVCSNDFLRWLPQRPVPGGIPIPPKINTRDDNSMKGANPNHHPATSTALVTATAPALTYQQERILQQPPRNSCSFPGKTSDHRTAESAAALIEQKLGSANILEPFILTRCKSEPMRAEMKLPPDGSCLWKNRKLEPHRRPVNNLVKAAGFGY